MFFISSILVILAVLLWIPSMVLAVECFLALLARKKQPISRSIHRPRIAILIPAHNEEQGIAATLEPLLPQLTETDRLIVVADNCNDRTADIARSYGAIVLERQNLEQQGKGYALDYGIQYLVADPPDVLLLIDADCEVIDPSVDRLATLAIETMRPVQAIYLMEQPENPSAKDAISAMAFLVKNKVRPTGLSVLNMPCLLTGTGMAFPWAIVNTISLASGNIVEDMQLSIDLAIAGHPPLLCRNVTVMGRLPQQDHAATTQRTRWEHGHLQTLFTQIPRLLDAAVRQQRWDLLSMALDLVVPPLSLLVMLWLVFTPMTLVAAIWGINTPQVIAISQGVLIGLSILGVWAKFGRNLLSVQTLLAIPLYILWKLPLYVGFLVHRQTKWVRTSRDNTDPAKES